MVTFDKVNRKYTIEVNGDVSDYTATMRDIVTAVQLASNAPQEVREEFYFLFDLLLNMLPDEGQICTVPTSAN
jgi:hypothetical protein